MKKLFISLLICLFAGIIDVIPMVIMRLNYYACFSAFFQWIILNLIINYIDIKIKGILKGLVVAEIVIIPVLIIVSQNGFLGILPIIGMAAFLGSLMGFFSEKFAK